MVIDVRMPKLGLSEAEMILVTWEKSPGDPIAVGDIIATVEGEKLTNNIEAETDGILGEHLVGQGDEVAINTLLTTIIKQ